MNNEYQENGALTGPLIFTLPASSFVVVLSFNWLDRTDRAVVAPKKARLELSGNSAENGEGFRGRDLERKAGSRNKLPKR